MNAILNAPPAAAPREQRPPVLLLLGTTSRPWQKRSFTFGFSLLTHGLLIAAVITLPLLTNDELPATAAGIRAFFAAPPDVTPPPPPPPPPAGRLSAVPRKAEPTPPPPSDSTFRAPLEVPDVIRAEPVLDLGVEGGVAGGVEGGMAGGVVGGVVGGVIGAPTAAPPVVRIGGQVKAPKLLHRVDPIYPVIALQARITGKVTLRAIVDTRGFVQEVRIENGPPLLGEAAAAAVRQWRYQPLLLNGEPRPFDLDVVVSFGLKS